MKFAFVLFTLSLFILLVSSGSSSVSTKKHSNGYLSKSKRSLACSNKPFDPSFLKKLTYKQFFKLIRGKKGKKQKNRY